MNRRGYCKPLILILLMFISIILIDISYYNTHSRTLPNSKDNVLLIHEPLQQAEIFLRKSDNSPNPQSMNFRFVSWFKGFLLCVPVYIVIFIPKEIVIDQRSKILKFMITYFEGSRYKGIPVFS